MNNIPPSPAHSSSPDTAGKSTFRYKWVWIGAFLFLAFLVFLYFRHPTTSSNSPDKHRQTRLPVGVETAQTGDMPVILVELGTVVPIANVTVQTRVSGHLLKVYFQEGDYVKKGDLLALIDPRPFEATKAQYEGTLAADMAQLQQARLDNGRYQRLIRQNSVSAMTAQDQQYKVAQLEGQIKVDKALIQQQSLNIMYSHITAPVDGRVGIRQVDAGNYVTAGQSGGLVILTQMEPMSVILTLPESQIGPVVEQLRAKKSLNVEAWDSTDQKKLATGTTQVIDSEIDTATGTVRMRAIFPNKDYRLFPNEFVNAHLLVDTLHNVIIIPSHALQTGPNGQFVYVVGKDNTIDVRDVKTGITHADHTVITQGLKAGETVVTEGTDHLSAGTHVSIQDDRENTPPSASPSGPKTTAPLVKPASTPQGRTHPKNH